MPLKCKHLTICQHIKLQFDIISSFNLGLITTDLCMLSQTATGRNLTASNRTNLVGQLTLMFLEIARPSKFSCNKVIV